MDTCASFPSENVDSIFSPSPPKVISNYLPSLSDKYSDKSNAYSQEDIKFLSLP